MLLLTLLLHIGSAPPVPPPPTDSAEAAMALWADHPPSERARQLAIDAAVGAAAERALAAVGILAGASLRATKRWLAYHDRLRPIITRRVPRDLAQVDQAALACVVDQVARALTPAEIGEVRRSMATPAGKAFWSATGLTDGQLNGCYAEALSLRVLDADYRAIGLRPPKPAKSYAIGYIVS